MSIGQCQRGRSLDIAAEPIRYDFDETNFSAGNFRHFAVVLAEVVARLNLVYEAVLGLDEPVEAAAHLEGADHSERVERKTFQKFAVAPRARASRLAVGRARPLRLEGRAHPRGAVHISFVGLHFRQRLNASARLFLGGLDPFLQIRLAAGTAGRDQAGEYDSNEARVACIAHVAPPAFFFAERPPPSSSM